MFVVVRVHLHARSVIRPCPCACVALRNPMCCAHGAPLLAHAAPAISVACTCMATVSGRNQAARHHGDGAHCMISLSCFLTWKSASAGSCACRPCTQYGHALNQAQGHGIWRNQAARSCADGAHCMLLFSQTCTRSCTCRNCTLCGRLSHALNQAHGHSICAQYLHQSFAPSS